MTCDELELSLPDPLDPAGQAHLEQCARCQQTAALLAAAAQPEPSAAEKAKLAGLPSAIQERWLRQQQRRSAGWRVGGLALAASLGAVLAAGVMWKHSSAPAVEERAEPEVVVLIEEPAPASDDELSFEVSWPSLNEEGDVL